MKIFVIHRFHDKKNAKRILSKLKKDAKIEFKATFLKSFNSKDWKKIAESKINCSEVIFIFNPKFCLESENAKWEIDKATSLKKNIIEYSEENKSEYDNSIHQLKKYYNFEEEFEECFSGSNEDKYDFYKLMIDSSENLIQRRQKTNAFFITAIGSLLTIAGFLVKTGALTSNSSWILYIFAAIGILLCSSWRHLIDNYGKLNTAKYEVILRLEKDFKAKIYSAEWLALGKGNRPKKYRSFTSTEKNVPLYFAILIILLSIVIAIFSCYNKKSSKKNDTTIIKKLDENKILKVNNESLNNPKIILKNRN